jgi:hypothetical protein
VLEDGEICVFGGECRPACRHASDASITAADGRLTRSRGLRLNCGTNVPHYE